MPAEPPGYLLAHAPRLGSRVVTAASSHLRLRGYRGAAGSWRPTPLVQRVRRACGLLLTGPQPELPGV